MKLHSTIVFQKSKNRFRFQHPVPQDLRALVGSAWLTHGLTAMPESDWNKFAAERVSFYNDLFERLRALDETQAAQLIALGGWKALGEAIPADARFGLPAFSAWHVAAAAVASNVFKLAEVEPAAIAGDVDAAVAMVRLQARQRGARAALAGVAALEGATGTRAKGATGTKITDLVTAWKRQAGARNLEDQAERVACALRKLVEVTGKTFAHEITKADARKFRDVLPRTDAGAKHLRSVKVCFRLAYDDEEISENHFDAPGMVIKVPTKTEEEERQAFLPAHIETIRAMLPQFATKVPSRRMIWRICLTSAARSGEVCGLTAADIVDVQGVACYHFRETKDGSNRFVPIHPALIDDVRALALEAKGGALFPEYADENGAGRFQDRSAEFIRDVCEITDKRFTLHSARHTVLAALAAARVDEVTIASISGHSKKKGEHGVLRRYTKVKATPAEMLAAIEALPAALII